MNGGYTVVRIAVPLLVYLGVVFAVGMLIGHVQKLGYPRTTTLAFTAAGNNVELAIAVAIATFGVTSGQALAGVVGPLIEVPVLVGLVYGALLSRRFFRPSPLRPSPSRPSRSRIRAPTLTGARQRSLRKGRADRDPGAVHLA